MPVAIDGFARDRKNHLLVECGGDATMGCGSTGGGGYLGLEQFVSYDPADNDSSDACKGVGIKSIFDLGLKIEDGLLRLLR